MEEFGSLSKRLIENALSNNPAENGDYENDGILYCGKCHTPRRKKIDINGEMTIVPVMCKCREEKRAWEEEQERKIKEMERINGIRRGSLIDKMFMNSTFDNARVNSSNERIVKICKRYAERFDEMIEKNQGLLFYGDVGTGKTYMAACISNYLMEHLTPVVMTSFVKLLQNTASFRPEEDESEYLSKLNKAKLLVIDDLGAERDSTYALEKVYNIVDSRYRAKLPVIFTTNLTLGEMKANTDMRYARIYDRIFEMCYPVEFTGTSWRRRQAKNRYDEMKSLLEDEE